MDKRRAVPNKKRHHYVPVSYLARFADDDGYLYAYRKDDPGKCLRSRPEAIGFQKYYYKLAARLSAGERVRKEDVSYLLGFAALQRVRVPAARDLAERALAHEISKGLRALNVAGLLDPKPAGLENILDLVQVTIDPHKSMEAMAPLLQHLGPIFDSIGYQIIHNQTDLSFITSDNPVSYFDPWVPQSGMQPYRIEVRNGPVELLFPIDPRTMLRGHSDDRHRFARRGLKHVDVRGLQGSVG